MAQSAERKARTNMARYRTWTSANAAKVVRAIYMQLLKREADDSGLIQYAELLKNGKKSPKWIIQNIALSKEFRNKWIKGTSAERIVKRLYRLLLARGVESKRSHNYWVRKCQDEGYDYVISGLMGSREYKTRFGLNGVPSSPK